MEKAFGASLWELGTIINEAKPLFDKVTGSFSQEETRIVTPTPDGGEFLYYNVVMYPLVIEGFEGVVIRVDDISANVKKDEHLRQAQKMDLLGSITSGLAHDFNNVISSIEATISSVRFSIDRARDLETLRGELGNDIDIIDEAAKLASDILDQLMSITRREANPEFIPFDLNISIKRMVEICKSTAPDCVEFELVCYDERSMSEGYPAQIEQALLNLLVNASHAMTIMRAEDEPQGGKVSVYIQQIFVGPNMTSSIPEAQEGNYWMITVSDTGVGMDRDTLTKIFDPFFSTKEKTRGTGLGLSIVYNVVRRHNGFIEINSAPGAGTNFFIFLPCAEVLTSAETVSIPIPPEAQTQPVQPAPVPEVTAAPDSEQNAQPAPEETPESENQEDSEAPEEETPESENQEDSEAPEEETPESENQEDSEAPEEETPESENQEDSEAPEEETGSEEMTDDERDQEENQPEETESAEQEENVTEETCEKTLLMKTFSPSKLEAAVAARMAARGAGAARPGITDQPVIITSQGKAADGDSGEEPIAPEESSGGKFDRTMIMPGRGRKLPPGPAPAKKENSEGKFDKTMVMPPRKS
jgi:signal transduction histidine kinase